MKSRMLLAVGMFLASVNVSASVINVTSANELGSLTATIASASEDVTVNLPKSITANSNVIIYNQNSALTITLVDPSTVGGYGLSVPSLNQAKIVLKNVTFSAGMTDTSGKVVIETDEEPDATAFPETTVILPSAQRQVYFGYPTLKGVTSVTAQISADGENWSAIVEADLIRRDETSAEPTMVGWCSIRYINATPGGSAWYRLVASGAEGEFVSSAVQVTTASAGTLHSRAGAKTTIYLDFDGYVDDYRGNAATAGRDYIVVPKFSDSSTLSIAEIWRLVAEDFIIFDVDVTTEEPPLERLVKSSADDPNYGKRVVIDAEEDPWYTAGGISGLGAFGFRVDRPAYIFGRTIRDNIAAQITHEVSHTTGLAHDGGKMFYANAEFYMSSGFRTLVNEFVSSEYYSGQPIALNCRWYPVMGGVPQSDDNDYVNQFSSGDYDGATNNEDDFAVLLGLKQSAREAEGKSTIVAFPEALYPDGADAIGSRNFSLIADDVGDNLATAADYSGAVTNLISKHVSGVEATADVDVYRFALAEDSEVTIKVRPEYLGSEYGVSLDAKVELLSKTGEVLAVSSDPLANDADGTLFRRAEICRQLTKGTYYVRVSGGNHPVNLEYAPSGEADADGVYASVAGSWSANARSAEGSVGQYILSIDAPLAPISTTRSIILLYR